MNPVQKASSPASASPASADSSASSFGSLPLSQAMQANLVQLGYTEMTPIPVSYTHLTLPTILLV